MNNHNQIIVESIITTPYECKVEYKYEDEKIQYSKNLPNSLKPPFNCSIIPDAIASNFESLKNFIVLKEALHPGVYIKTKIIGALKYSDSKDIYHEKILSVPYNFTENDITEISNFDIQLIKSYIIHYHNIMLNERIRFSGFLSRDDAVEIYKVSSMRYKAIQKQKNEEKKNNVFRHFMKFIKRKKKNNNDTDTISSDSSQDTFLNRIISMEKIFQTQEEN